MNREIKFRAWNRVTNQMLDLKKITPFALHPVLDAAGLFLPFDDAYALMQYTGLQDRNGTDVYEGDVCGFEGERVDLCAAWRRLVRHRFATNFMTIHICYLPKLVKRKPKDPMKGYRMLVPYKFDWRERLGKVECDCKLIIECYRPWYGFNWSHHPDCAINRHIERYPGILNIVPWDGIIAYTD